MKLKVIITYCFILPYALIAQNMPVFTNIHETGLFYNPSCTGNSMSLNATALTRQQWVGYEGAPSTTLISCEAFLDKFKSGVGFVIFNDALGYENSLGLKVNYSYKYFLDNNSFISMGANIGFLNTRYDALTLVYEEFDPNGFNTSLSAFMPDIGAGICIKYNLIKTGISVTNTFENVKSELESSYPLYCHIFAGYQYPVSASVVISPLLQWHFNSKNPVANGGLIFTVNNKIHAGATYRFKEAINVLFGYQFNNKLRAGYSYDLATGSLKSYHSGSHEIYINVSFAKVEKEVFYLKSPRYF